MSPVGAVGLTQLMPATAKLFRPGITRQDLKQPDTNLHIGFKYLKELIDRYDGNEKLALTAYNRGPGTVDKLLKHGRNPDNGYAEKVLTGKSQMHTALMNKKFGVKTQKHTALNNKKFGVKTQKRTALMTKKLRRRRARSS
jgi:soluble lytic murein transglycosylase-like protein